MSSGTGTKLVVILFDYLMVCIGFAFLGLAYWKNWSLSPELIALVSMSNGIFLKCIADFHNFEWGSSRGSQAKDATIATALADRSTPQP